MNMIPAEIKIVKEGSATVNFPKEVFYNPVQEFNRDLTICMINTFNKYRQKTSTKVRSEFDFNDCFTLNTNIHTRHGK